MHISIGSLADAQVDALALVVTGQDAVAAFLESDAGSLIDAATPRRYLGERLFADGAATVVEWPLPDRFHASVLLFVNCGEGRHAERIRQAFGIAARKARDIGSGRLGLVADGLDATALGATVEGAILGGWAFRRRLGSLRSDKVAPSADVSVLATGDLNGEVQAAVDRAALVARATIEARNLVSEPANVIDPRTFEEAERVADEHGFRGNGP